MGMKVTDFLNMVRKATELPSLYVMGGWGYPLNESNKERTQKNSYNQRPERKKKIYEQTDDVFAWDCCGLCKGVVWGWFGDKSLKNGGAVYASNGLPDWDAKEIMFKGTTEQSTDFSKIEAGEFLWLDGHCGIYLGDGLAAESTPIWKDGAQITAVANIGTKPGYNSRKWTYHGHLKCIDYTVEPETTYIVGDTYKVLCDDLMVRSGAGTNYDSIGELNKGDKIKCIAIESKNGNTWIQHEKGWSAGIYNGSVYIGNDGWVKEDGKWYYYDDNIMLTSAWVKWRGVFYYVGADGVMVTGWNKINDKDYFFHDSGICAQDEWITKDKAYLFLGMDGAQTYRHKGSWNEDSKGKWFEDTSGWYAKSRSILIDGKEYSFNKDGYLI